MKCPVCSEPDLVMSERQGIEIDYCPKCRGVWLDRGELDKIIDRSDRDGRRDDDRRGDQDRGDDDDERRRLPPYPGGHAPPPPPGGGYGQPYDPRHPKHHKKKSFWHELFDD
jgi:hypothetical protein